MQDADAQEIWTDYFQRKKAQRMEEAAKLWQQAALAGVTSETELTLDFQHFGPSRNDIESLAKQLSENYEMQVIGEQANYYWNAKGTTRPYVVTLTEEQHMSWVEFMCDVAHSYACVFSTWSLEAPSLGVQLRSETIDSAS